MGQSPSSSNYSENEDDTILIQGNADLINGKVVPRIYTSEITKISKPGDIILTVRAPVGDLAINEFNSCIGRGVCSIEGNKFIYYFLQSLKNKHVWERLSQGSTFESINSNDIKNLNVKIPSKKIQKSISSFLTIIDNKIELLEKKYSQYQDFKKYLMQQMQQIFTQKLRFDFKDEWKITKLGEITKINTGNKDVKDKIDNGKYPFFVRSEKVERINSYSFDGEAILIPGDGKIGEVYHYINGKFDYHQRVYKISDFKNNINGKYIYYYLEKNFLKQALKNSAKATVDSLRMDTLTKMPIELPSFEEQVEIVDILSLADEKIGLIEKNIKISKHFKRGLLQQMFV